MSDQNPPQTPQTAAGEAAAHQEIAEFFKQDTEVRTQPRLRGLRGVCRFDITGVGIWNIAVNDGQVTVIEGAGNALPADCVVTGSAQDTLRIIHRENYMNLLTAAMQGLITVTGDKVFAMALLGNFVQAPLATTRQS